jgi:hypothetical protein
MGGFWDNICPVEQFQRRHKPVEFGINPWKKKKTSKKREWHGFPSILEGFTSLLDIFVAFLFAILLHAPGF